MSPEREAEIREYIAGLPNFWSQGYEYLPDLLDEVERLRAENTEAHQHLRNLIDECEQRRDKITFAEAKLAKAATALDNYRYQHEKDLGMVCHCPPCLAARQTLKEIKG